MCGIPPQIFHYLFKGQHSTSEMLIQCLRKSNQGGNQAWIVETKINIRKPRFCNCNFNYCNSFNWENERKHGTQNK